VLVDKNTISRHLREREIRRQIRYNHVRKAVAGRLPTGLHEFLQTFGGALLGFFIVAELLAYFADVKPLYTLSALGTLYSMQATYYKYKLSVDPAYIVPKCKCAGLGNDKTDVVLRSSESAIFGVPNSVLATLLYPTLFVLVYSGHEQAALPIGLLGVVGSAYLSYVMVVRLASLCSICVNVAALNVLILWQLAF